MSKFGLVPIRVASWGPFILLNLDPEIFSRQDSDGNIGTEWLVSAAEILSANGVNSSLSYLCRREYTIECNWKEVAKRHAGYGNGDESEYKLLPGGPSGAKNNDIKDSSKEENYTTNCSTEYWVLNLLQIPVSVGVTLYEALSLYSGKRVIASKADSGTRPGVKQLIIYCLCGVLAGVVGGLLGLGGGFIMGPLFLELGVPPQVSSATATFAMMFSSSMSVVEYYLLKRFPVPYALYFICVATIAAFVGQHVVRRIINILGRASLIIFILASTIFISAISLGGVGIANTITKIQKNEYMGFENLCNYQS